MPGPIPGPPGSITGSSGPALCLRPWGILGHFLHLSGASALSVKPVLFPVPGSGADEPPDLEPSVHGGRATWRAAGGPQPTALG